MNPWLRLRKEKFWKLDSRPAVFWLIISLLLLVAPDGHGQSLSWPQRIARSVMQQWPQGHIEGSGAPVKGSYELATLLNGMDAAWYDTADGDDFRYVQSAMDAVVTSDGAMPGYDATKNSLDNVAIGRTLLLLYRVTQKEKYYKAARLLRAQLDHQPRTHSGGFWHKQIYPNQMWLDGLYMAEPFYAEYADVFHESGDFTDVTKQFELVDRHLRSAKTGLLYHAWDESKRAPWSDKQTGDSHIVWARGMGWTMMALVDTIPYYPKNDPGRAVLLRILNRTAEAVIRSQDPQTGLWYQVMDRPHQPGNYLESSAACMFTYALQKGVRLGYLPKQDSANAERAWRGILSHFVQTEADGSVRLSGTVKSIGLGGTPYRDGSYHYYVSAPVVANDPKGVGAFLLAATEMEMAPQATLAHGKTVLLDAWFNSQQRTNAAGVKEYFHYKWNDFSNSGYSLFGHLFKSHGAEIRLLDAAPTLSRLQNAQFYIIVSPDIPVWNPHPHYVQPEDAKPVAAWVKDGGVLVILENDPANADITHLDLIADQFGIHFDNVLRHHIIKEQFEPGYIHIKGEGPIFRHPHLLYMKDTCAISLKGSAVPMLSDASGPVIAEARYGKGKVVGVIDPWLYNEYTDHRKTAPNPQNFDAGKEFVSWLLKQLHTP